MPPQEVPLGNPTRKCMHAAEPPTAQRALPVFRPPRSCVVCRHHPQRRSRRARDVMFATGYSTDMASLGVDAFVDMSPFDRAVI